MGNVVEIKTTLPAAEKIKACEALINQVMDLAREGGLAISLIGNYHDGDDGFTEEEFPLSESAHYLLRVWQQII